MVRASSDRRRLQRGPVSLALAGVVLTLLCAAFSAGASDSPGPWGAVLFPLDDLYAPYAADPHRTGFGVQWLSVTDTGIADSGNSRVALRAGGTFGIVRFHPYGEEGRGWQIGIEGGFNAQFDADHSLDNIGWDGKYGLVVTSARSAAWAFKFGVLHDSAHVGDEYMERTGRKRIGYTRHELAAGASWRPDERFRTYAEAAWGYSLSNEQLQEPGRVQFGLEYETLPSPGRGRWGWYGAADVSAMEERNWRVDRALQAGLAMHRDGRTWRFGIEWYDGRPPLGEFFQVTETYVSLGLWVDI